MFSILDICHKTCISGIIVRQIGHLLSASANTINSYEVIRTNKSSTPLLNASDLNWIDLNCAAILVLMSYNASLIPANIAVVVCRGIAGQGVLGSGPSQWWLAWLERFSQIWWETSKLLVVDILRLLWFTVWVVVKSMFSNPTQKFLAMPLHICCIVILTGWNSFY